MKQRIVFRADGNSQIGLGHLVRSLALAYLLKDEFNCFFAIQNPVSGIITQITASGAVPVVLPQNADYKLDAHYFREQIIIPGDVVVLDGYYFDFEYQLIIEKKEVTLICIDDIQAYPFLADAIINHAGGINADNYQVQPHTKLFLGPTYALLREPFLKAAAKQRFVSAIKKIIINMGGADPENYTCQIVTQILTDHSYLSLEVVIGSAFSHHTELQELISSNLNITLHQNLDADEMCRLMQSCDAAILPPSSVSYEWCSVGGPLFLHPIANNQKHIYLFLLENNLAFPFEELSSILNKPDPGNLITEQIQNQKSWFNGQSRQKLLAVFYELIYYRHLVLRPVTEADTLLLFDWANDPEVRQNSFSTEPISLEIHQIWFKNKLQDPDCIIYIAEVKKIPAGMIRFDLVEQTATISYLLAEDFRGKKLGTLLLQKGLEALQDHNPTVEKAIGHIQEDNVASISAFKNNNFKPDYTLPLSKPGSVIFAKNLK